MFEYMHTIYLLSVWLHIIAAMIWVGGICFLAFALVPVLHKPEHRRQALTLIQETGRRFRNVGWAAWDDPSVNW